MDIVNILNISTFHFLLILYLWWFLKLFEFEFFLALKWGSTQEEFLHWTNAHYTYTNTNTISGNMMKEMVRQEWKRITPTVSAVQKNI